MSCPVCNQTMQNLGSPDRRVFWCSGCGTLKEESGDFSQVEMPANLRHIITAAKLVTPQQGQTQRSTVEPHFRVSQRDLDHPQVEMAIYGGDGRRLF